MWSHNAPVNMQVQPLFDSTENFLTTPCQFPETDGIFSGSYCNKRPDGRTKNATTAPSTAYITHDFRGSENTKPKEK